LEGLSLPESPMTEKETSYRADIDGLRAIAVLSVIFYHLNFHWLTGGFIGVDVFFVISGFVVTGSLTASRTTGALSFIGEFYARRLARIMPALVVVLCITALLATFFIPHAWLSRFSETTALFAFFGLSNWVMQHNNDTYFAPLAESNPYSHTWSLGVEEQFYLVAPLIIYLWLRTRRASHASGLQHFFLFTLFMLCVASFAGCFYTTGKHPTDAFYFIGFRFWELGLGALLYLVTLERTPSTAPVARTLGFILPWFGALLIALACANAKENQFPWPWALPAVLGSLFIIGGVHAAKSFSPVRGLLALSPMVWIGKRSYSIYLWHWPIYVLLRWTIGIGSLPVQIAAVAASLVMAMLSYRYVETPLRHHAAMERWQPPYRIAFFILLTGLGWRSTQYLFDNYDSFSLSTVSRHADDWYVGSRMPHVIPDARPCKVDRQNCDIGGGRELRYIPQDCGNCKPKGNMYVLGDSHALAYLPMFDQLSAETGLTISVYTLAGCSYIPFFSPMSQSCSPACDSFTNTVVQRVLESARGGDMLFLPSLRIYRYGDQWENYGHDVFQIMYNSESLRLRDAAIDEARQLLQPFADKKLRVIFEAPTPIFQAPPFRCSDWFNQNNPICIGNNQQPRSTLEQLREPVLAGMRRLTDALPDVSVWDPFPVLCPGIVCSATKDGRPLFFDGDHLSAYGNMILYPDFKAYIDMLTTNQKQG
jgi:peptidoglycan/LPS O-acetylase OafA/YrhL